METTVLLKLPRNVVVPLDVAQDVFALLAPHIGSFCEVSTYGSTFIKYLKSDDACSSLGIFVLTQEALAKATLDT